MKAPIGDSVASRIQFVEACSAWLKRLSVAFGYKADGEQVFTELSLLAIVFETQSDAAPAGPEPKNTLALCDLTGEPAYELLYPDRSDLDSNLGLPPLSRSELRECLDTTGTMINRGGLWAPPLEDGELWYIAINAEKSDTHGPDHWRQLYGYLRRRMNGAIQRAESLAEWAERARLRALGRLPKEKRLAWVGTIKKRIEQAIANGETLSLRDAAASVGKSESTVWRQFPHYFKRGGSRYSAPQGILGEDGEVKDATREKLPAKSNRRIRGKK